MVILSKQSDPSNPSRGFTIVELLIVIVIIGILAAIAVVAYNGIRYRASNSSRVAVAKQYATMFQAYEAQYGKYPFNSGVEAEKYCLGTGFKDVTSDGIGDCYDSQPGVYWLASESTVVNNELAKVGSLPSGDRSYITAADGMKRVGPVGVWTNNVLYIYYILDKPSPVACPAGEIEWEGDQNTLICRIKVGSR